METTMSEHGGGTNVTRDEQPWQCRSCGAALGRVLAGVLRIGGVPVLPGATVVCPTCGHTRTWHSLPPASHRSTGAAAGRSVRQAD